jgi:hypothetical protein
VDDGRRARGRESIARTPLIVLLAAGLLVAGCGGDSDDSGQAASTDAPKVEDPGPIHVHGLGINPEDGALFVATHTGLFRAAEGEPRATRVADRFQDTMGFTVVGPNRFLGSGHPDGREGLPPFLGLIESRDAGRTWEPISLLGKRDFHVLEATDRRVYGFGSDFDSGQAGLLVSDDGGHSWDERTPLEALVSLAIDPGDPDHVVVSGEQGLYVSSDGGRGWRPLEGGPALLAWPAGGPLFAVAFDGSVARSGDAGGSWRQVGQIGDEPAAFEGAAGGDLYAALHDGTIKRSANGGASWSVRATP